MTVKVSTIDSFVNDLAPGFEPVVNGTLALYPFGIRVLVIRGRPPRHDFFEYFKNIGFPNIEKVLYDRVIHRPTFLTFFFPERHMSIHETQRFMSCMNKHHQAGEIDLVDIITSSPIILSNFTKDMIRIISFEDDYIYEGRSS